MANHNDQQNPGCLPKILRIFGIKEGSSAASPQEAAIDLESLPYRIRDDFLSSAELSFYLVLNNVVGDKAVICPKVNLSDIFYVSRPNENLSYRGRISQKHIDFLLCEVGTMRPLVGIELDDSSHARSDRQNRDNFVDRVFQDAGLPLERFPAQFGYHLSDLKLRIAKYLKDDNTNAVSASVPKTAAPVQPAGEAAGVAAPTSAPNCPKCGARMVVRTATRGEYQGKQFYACPNYPKCQQILPLRN